MTFRKRVKGYIARGVLTQDHSYGNREPRTIDELYELTQPECVSMTPQLPGTPVWHSHNEFGVDDDEPVRLGTVMASQFNRKTGDWQVELELEGECAELLWNTHCAQSDAGLSLSLSHGKQSKQPREVSVCFKGMREGSRIITNEKSYRPTEPSQAGKSSGSNRDAAYVSASAKPMSTPGDNRMDTDNAPATNKAAAAAAAVPGAQSAPAPKTSNEMETDATDDYVKRIHKAAAAFPVGPERDAFYKQQIEIHKRTKQLARQNEQLKKRSAAMTQTYATSIMELLRNQGQSTAQLEKDITEKEALDMHAPYMEFVAGAAKGWLQAKQPAPAQTAPAPKEEAHPWDLLLRQATKDDDMDDRALSSVTANKHINGSSGGSSIDTKGYDRFEQELKDADLIQASYRPGQYQQQQQQRQQPSSSSNGDYMTMFNQAMNQQYSDVPLDSIPRHVVGSKMTETINDTPIGPSRKRHRTQE